MNWVPELLYLGQKTVHRKNLSSQCNLTAQIELVQDKLYYLHSTKVISFPEIQSSKRKFEFTGSNQILEFILYVYQSK